MKPGPGISPVAVHGPFRKIEGFRGFLNSQSDEEAQFDDFSNLGFFLRQFDQCFIDRQQSFIGFLFGQFHFIKLLPPLIAAVAEPFLRRAFSIKIRLMASEAAAKKCPRPFQDRSALSPIRRT